MPPIDYEKPFIMFTVNQNMVPSRYNGIRLMGKEIEVVDIRDPKENSIKIKAVTCRVGFKDSKVFEQELYIQNQQKPTTNFIMRAPQHNVVLPPSSD